MASVPISAITPLLVQLSPARPSPVRPPVGAAAGEVGALIVLSTAQLGAAAGEIGAAAWGGWGGGYGGLYSYAGAAPGMGGYGFGLGGAFCYPTFDYSTGWNQFCPGYGFAFGNRPAQ